MERKTSKSGKGFGRIALIYLMGLLVGGLYVGLVAPLRMVVQSYMGIPSETGIWMINIYTLFYAALIPVSGMLADRMGRKKIFTGCVGLFSIGALMCGLSQFAGGFALMIVGRIVQAAGAGGIIPVATAEMGASAPEGKRGMWLGVATGVAGLSNVLGAAVGSLVISIVGIDGWCWAFFIAIPIGVLLILGALAWLPDHTGDTPGKIDFIGSTLFVSFVLLLLFSLNGLDFNDFAGTFVMPQTWVPLVAAIVILPIFRKVELRAETPIFHLEYLRNRSIVIIMIVSFFVGCSIISMMLVPEYAEYLLGIPTGSGGYYMSVMGVFAVVGPPVCGKLIDRFGAKPIMTAGLAVLIAGYLFLALVTTPNPSSISMIIGLAIVGLGMGFAMGTPLNYMILECTKPEQSNSAIATLALVRQMGTTVAPAILVGLVGTIPYAGGYANMLLAVAVFNVISLVLTLCYKRRLSE